MATRVCGKCGEQRDCEADFYAASQSGRRRKDGKRSHCKRCSLKKPGQQACQRVCNNCGATYYRPGRRGSLTVCHDCAELGQFCRRCKQFKLHDRFWGGRTKRDPVRLCLDGCARDTMRERTLGLAAGTLPQVLARFSDCCGICGATETSGERPSLHVDHCHATGAIRGLLCGSCNLGLGKFKDNPALLTAAIEYIRRAEQLAA